MTKQQKYDAIISAYMTKPRGDDPDKQIIVIKDTTPPEITDKLLEIQRDIDAGFNRSYDIVSDAASYLSGIELSELEKAEFQTDTPSVYTATRLSYLDINNQADISQIMKDYNCDDIATAAAVWYENKVNEACEALRSYILAD